ncbi:MAG: SEC-C metal-binding domain-containing protein [Candidatus Gastranaerophilaceae bacterium]
MTITDNSTKIFHVIDKISNFLIRDLNVGKDFRNFSQVEFKSIPQEELRSRTLSYLFSRKISGKSVFDFIEENNFSTDDEELDIVKAIRNSFAGVFQIKKLLSDGFELYSLINERDYTVKTVGARTNYRGAYVGAYLFCCLCHYADEYYTCDLRAITGSDKEGGAMRYAITKIVENPSLVFFDNKQKLAEIKAQIKIFDKKFNECFASNEVITTNKQADDLINAFNDYCDSGNEDIRSIVQNIKKPEKYGYFPTKDFNFTTEDFEKKSKAGFSSQGSEYDVGILFIKDAGLFAIPFYGTFCKIFEEDDYKNIPNYLDCLRNFLNNDKIPKVVFKFIANKYTNVAERISEILNEKYTLKQILTKFKHQKEGNTDISTAAILYSSKIFADLMQREKKEKQEVEKVGRNELCPCGSGKKYKKCCGKD